MPTYEIRISQGSNASKYAVDLPNEATARDEVIAIFGDLARDFARELLQDPWNIEILDPAQGTHSQIDCARRIRLAG